MPKKADSPVKAKVLVEWYDPSMHTRSSTSEKLGLTRWLSVGYQVEWRMHYQMKCLVLATAWSELEEYVDYIVIPEVLIKSITPLMVKEQG